MKRCESRKQLKLKMNSKYLADVQTGCWMLVMTSLYVDNRLEAETERLFHTFHDEQRTCLLQEKTRAEHAIFLCFK